jgi:hypothetical protein
MPALSFAQTGGLDSASGVGEVSDVRAGITYAFEFNATSGPSGENPSGHAFVIAGDQSVEGPVTCLAVSDNRAVVGVRNASGTSFLDFIEIEAVDGGASGDRFSPVVSFTPPDCQSGFGAFLVTDGHITVVDAQPFPTAKDQCKNGGWKTYGVFKNQGDCVSFVATGGKNPPAKSG